MFQPDWSRDLQAGARGLALARERGWLLVWDEAGWLTLFDHAGQCQSQRQCPNLLSACAAEDGTAYAAISKTGQIWWFAPDFSPRWETKLPFPPLNLALDPFGQFLAVSGAKGSVHFFDRTGKQLTELTLPRPLLHLAFVPAAPFLIGCADFGLVAAVNLQGETLWRDGLFTNVGGLAVDGVGRQLLLASFSEGLHRYQSDGKKLAPLATPEPCRLVVQSFEGSRILISNMTNRLLLLNQQGKVLATREMEKAIVALALGPLGKEVYVALAKGPVLRLVLPPLEG